MALNRRTGAATTTQVNYLNSVKFMNQFLDVLLDCLSEPLNLGNELDSAPVQGGRIIIKQGIATHHLFPALPGKFWPDSGHLFLIPGGDNEHNWPTSSMQLRIKRMGVTILPLGTYQKIKL